MSLATLFGRARGIVIGMVHLGPLPGSPLYEGRLEPIRTAALRDASALLEAGIHGIMIENFGDVPFYPGRVPAETVAAMTQLASDIRRVSGDTPLGINVLRNDGLSAVAIAAVTGAAFVRINVLCGARVADQGVLQGQAHDILRLKRSLHAADVAILADVDVKHSAPLAPRAIEDDVDDTLERGLADGLIVSGAGTGKATDLEKVKRVKAAAKQAPVFIGSGADAQTAASFLAVADGLIVGTSLKVDGRVENPVDPARVRQMLAAAQG